MQVVSFTEVRDEIVNHLRGRRLLPILGSGFSRKCRAQNGLVPSGSDYKEYMISQICEKLGDPDKSKRTSLESQTFSRISSIYHKNIEEERQIQYLKDHFANVRLDANRKEFLKIDWPYLYTLNIDDAIEKNSVYNTVFYSNRKPRTSEFDSAKCLIKLHGDVHDMTKYADSECEIFTQEQYVASFKKNTGLLKRLEHDMCNQNTVYIGCSLDDEIDLLSCANASETCNANTHHYFCTTQKPDFIQEENLSRYNITHVVIFEGFDEIYSAFSDAWKDALQISKDMLSDYRDYDVRRLSCDYHDNIQYLLNGKSLFRKDKIIEIPYFFISREITDTIIRGLGQKTIQVVLGSGCSGKTYIMADIVCRVRNRSLYAFTSTDSVSEEAFNELAKKKDTVLLFDDKSLEISQIERIIQERSEFKKNEISVVIFANKNDRALYGLLKLYEMEHDLRKGEIPKYTVKNRFSAKEYHTINPLLTAISAGVFQESVNESIIDGIMRISDTLAHENKYEDKKPATQTYQQIAALILLAIRRKVYSREGTMCGVQNELSYEAHYLTPLLDSEETWDFEYSQGNNSPTKYVLNAEYWLFKQLGRLTKKKDDRKLVVKAFRYLITQIVAFTGKPDLYRGGKSEYGDLIYFDNINEIIYTQNRNAIRLIEEIYDSLSDLLSTDPGFMHQRAKCYLQVHNILKHQEDTEEYINKAYRDANVAYQIYQERYKKYGNKKLLISEDHVKYTMALSLCNKCVLHKYSDIEENSNALSSLYYALKSPYNSYDYVKTDSLNVGNIISNFVFKFMMNKTLIRSECRHMVSELLLIIRS